MKAMVAIVSSGFGNVPNKTLIYRPEDSENVEFQFRDLVWDALEVEFPDSFQFLECMDGEYRLFDGRGELLEAFNYPGDSIISFVAKYSDLDVRITDGRGVFGSDRGFTK